MARDNRASVARAGQLQDGRRKQEVIRIRPDGLPSVPDLGANQCSSRYCQAELEEANGAIPARHHVSAPCFSSEEITFTCATWAALPFLVTGSRVKVPKYFASGAGAARGTEVAYVPGAGSFCSFRHARTRRIDRPP